MRLDTGIKRWTRIGNFTCICMIWVFTDLYGYDTDVTGYLRIEAFAIAASTTDCGQNTIAVSQTRLPADSSFVSIRIIRNLSYHMGNRPYPCVPLLLCPYLCVSVRMTFSNVYLCVTVTCYYVSTLSFHTNLTFEPFQKLHVLLTDPADTIRTAADDCVYNTHIYGCLRIRYG